MRSRQSTMFSCIFSLNEDGNLDHDGVGRLIRAALQSRLLLPNDHRGPSKWTRLTEARRHRTPRPFLGLASTLYSSPANAIAWRFFIYSRVVYDRSSRSATTSAIEARPASSFTLALRRLRQPMRDPRSTRNRP